MKSIIFFGLIYLLILPLLAIGCDTASTTTLPPTTTPATTMPDINGGEEAKIIDITLDEFTAENNVAENIELVKPGSLIVRLGSNPTTGYAWGEAVISAADIVVQSSRDFVGPEDTGLVGAGGTDVWVFDSAKAGSATITFSYSRPWEGGEQNIYTLTINVTVK